MNLDPELKGALRDLIRKYHLGDYVYDIRERVREDEDEWFKNNPGSSSWDHPDIERFSDCVEIIEEVIKDG